MKERFKERTMDKHMIISDLYKQSEIRSDRVKYEIVILVFYKKSYENRFYSWDIYKTQNLNFYPKELKNLILQFTKSPNDLGKEMLRSIYEIEIQEKKRINKQLYQICIKEEIKKRRAN